MDIGYTYYVLCSLYGVNLGDLNQSLEYKLIRLLVWRSFSRVFGCMSFDTPIYTGEENPKKLEQAIWR